MIGYYLDGVPIWNDPINGGFFKLSYGILYELCPADFEEGIVEALNMLECRNHVKN